MSFAGSTTIGSDSINSFTIYKRVFTGHAAGSGEASFSLPLGLADRWTVMCQLSLAGPTGTRPVFSSGGASPSFGGEGADFLSTGRNRTGVWEEGVPTSGMVDIFVEYVNRRIIVYESTPGEISIRSTINVGNMSDGLFFRIGQGSAGNDIFHAFDYIGSEAGTAEFRSFAIWNRDLSQNQMKQLSSVFANGGLVV